MLGLGLNFIPLYSCRLVTFTIEADLANTQRSVAALPGRRRWHLHHETSMEVLAAVWRPDHLNCTALHPAALAVSDWPPVNFNTKWRAVFCKCIGIIRTNSRRGFLRDSGSLGVLGLSQEICNLAGSWDCLLHVVNRPYVTSLFYKQLCISLIS